MKKPNDSTGQLKNIRKTKLDEVGFYKIEVFKNDEVVKRTYLADIWLGKKRKRITMGNLDTLKKKVNSTRYEYEQGLVNPGNKKPGITFRVFADEYFKIHVVPNMREPKREEYRLRYLSDFFGNKELREIEQVDVERWKAKMVTSQKPASVNRRLVTLKALFNKAVDWGYLRNSPAKKVKKFEEEGRDNYLDKVQIEKITKMPDSRVKTFIVFAMNTGLRCANIVNLHWKDVNLKNGNILVPKSKSKSKKSYFVPINNVAMKILEERAKYGSIGLVFDTSNLRKEFETFMKVAGIQGCTKHDLRHTFASHLAMRGIDLYTIAELLGHSDIKMTRRYAHLAPDHKQIAVNVLNLGDDVKSGQEPEKNTISLFDSKPMVFCQN